jgi:hypothetical protein
VNIRLSVDGVTFPCYWQVIPNDGSEAIIVPNVTAKNCRILIEPVGNIYYAVNSSAFAMGYSVESACYLYIRSSFCYSEQVAYTTRTITVPSTLSSVADINFNVS